jgi:dephospho-CoA kinase
VRNVGLTGGIGAGKSEAARRFAAHGAVIIDADRLAREALAPGTSAHATVLKAFGDEILLPSGELDRAALGARIFADAAQRERLNAIVHPVVRQRTATIVREAGPDDIVVHDVPLLVENRLMAQYDVVIVVQAPLDLRLERLAARGLGEADALARIAAQASDAERAAVADFLLLNDGDLAHLHTQVDRLWPELTP